MVKKKALLASKSAKKIFFQGSHPILKQNRQKKANTKFYHNIVSSWSLGSL